MKQLFHTKNNISARMGEELSQNVHFSENYFLYILKLSAIQCIHTALKIAVLPEFFFFLIRARYSKLMCPGRWGIFFYLYIFESEHNFGLIKVSENSNVSYLSVYK